MHPTMSTVHSQQRPLWFTPGIQQSLNKLHTLCRKYHSAPTPSLFDKLTSSESALREQIANAKVCYESSLLVNLDNNHEYKNFSYITSLTLCHSIPPSVHFNSVAATSDYDKAVLFNQFFNSTFSHHLFSLVQTRVCPPLGLQCVTLNYQNQLCTER